MAQTLLDIFYSALQLSLLLSGLAAAQDQQSQLSHATAVWARYGCRHRLLIHVADLLGWLLLRLPGPGLLRLGSVCIEEDPLSLWAGVCLSSFERGRSLHPVYAQPQHHSQHRPCGPERFEHESLRHWGYGFLEQDSLYLATILSKRQPTRCYQRQSCQPYTFP